MGTYLFRTENVQVGVLLTTYTHGLGVAPANENGEVFIRHRTATYSATVLTSNSQIVVLNAANVTYPITVDLCVMAFHSIIK